jgi:signal transduction histidine kinase
MVRQWRSVRARDAYLEALRTRGRVRDVEVECLCNDGTLRTFLESTVGMYDEEGRLIEYQGIMTDITSIKQTKEALSRKNRELERANTELRDLDRMKDRFISTISHELRTPLTSIKGSLDILTKGMVGELEERIQGIVAICHRNAERLISLVEDLIQIQQLESSQEPLEIDEVRLDSVIPGVLDRIGKECEKKGIRLVSRIDPGAAAATILADGRKIQSALHNLLSNAVKFSGRGTVTLEATVSDGEIHLSVSDDGPGIPEQMRENIFEKFTQVDGSNTREKGGTGLGLAITRSIVEKHGGRIWVESEQGRGSRFTFSLPRRTNRKDAVEERV